jgi:hypothetical protein
VNFDENISILLVLLLFNCQSSQFQFVQPDWTFPYHSWLLACQIGRLQVMSHSIFSKESFGTKKPPTGGQ